MTRPETVITIDGPAGSGKSSSARALADRLAFDFLDTGAMYRSVAWKCLETGVELVRKDQVAETAARLKIELANDRVYCDGIDVTDAIRTQSVSDAASIVAAVASVREVMAGLQREAASGMQIVTEGRDQVTIVFPDAVCKFFLTASLQDRAQRRKLQLHQQGITVPIDQVLEQMDARDQRDVSRNVAPLKPADDAITVDTSGLSQNDVVNLLESTSRKVLSLGMSQ